MVIEMILILKLIITVRKEHVQQEYNNPDFRIKVDVRVILRC